MIRSVLIIIGFLIVSSSVYAEDGNRFIINYDAINFEMEKDILFNITDSYDDSILINHNDYYFQRFDQNRYMDKKVFAANLRRHAEFYLPEEYINLGIIGFRAVEASAGRTTLSVEYYDFRIRTKLSWNSESNIEISRPVPWGGQMVVYGDTNQEFALMYRFSFEW